MQGGEENRLGGKRQILFFKEALLRMCSWELFGCSRESINSFRLMKVKKIE